jgi:hypothetical protein
MSQEVINYVPVDRHECASAPIWLPSSLELFIFNIWKIHFKNIKKFLEKYIHMDNDIYFKYT